MRKLIYLILISCLIFSVEADTQKGNISVTVLGFENNEGKARLLLFSENAKDDFPSKPGKAFRKHNVKIVNNKVLFTFENIPYGNYAVSVHHDENDDDKVNTNWIGIPNEGLGGSNDAKGFMGPPSFEDAKIELNKNQLDLIINMVN